MKKASYKTVIVRNIYFHCMIRGFFFYNNEIVIEIKELKCYNQLAKPYKYGKEKG